MSRSFALALVMVSLAGTVSAQPNGPPPAIQAAPVSAPLGSETARALSAARAAYAARGEVLPSDIILTTKLISNAPVLDTPANRARYGGPNSHGGRLTKPSGD